MIKGELPCRGGIVETYDRTSLQFVSSGIRSIGDQIFLQAGTGFCFFWPYKRRPPAGFDLINPKHLLNACKLEADSIHTSLKLNLFILSVDF